MGNALWGLNKHALYPSDAPTRLSEDVKPILTARLQETKDLMDRGLNSAQIAHAMGISIQSVAVYKSELRHKIGLPVRQARADNSALEMTEDFAL